MTNINDTTTTRRLSLDLPAGLVEQIEAECATRMVGRGVLIEHLVRDGLTRLVPVADILLLQPEA